MAIPAGTHPSSSRGDDAAPGAVVALVGRIDLRAVRAVELALTLVPTVTPSVPPALPPAPGTAPVRALHVIEPHDDLHRIATEWMDLVWSSVPLDTVDLVTSVPATVAQVIADRRRREERDLTVVMGRLHDPGVGRHFLHDRTSLAIGEALAGVPGVLLRWVDIPIHA